MKKAIKPIVITLLIICIAFGGLYGGYKYNQGKKIVEVAAVSNYGMNEYWGDSIQSYGEVTSEKSQTAYLSSGTEILSVNVKEGDHVEAGDVLLTVKKDSQDINGKNLEIQKASQDLKVEQIKLSRLMDTEPVPTYIYTQNVYRDYSYTSQVRYKAIEEIADDGYGGKYEAGDVVAEESFTYLGKSLGFTYYIYKDTTVDGVTKRKSMTVDALGGDLSGMTESQIKESDLFEAENVTDTYNYLASVIYGDSETGKIVGETDYSIEGDTIHDKKVPEGMNAKQLEEAILDAQDSVKKKDLALRKLTNQLEVMKNTTDDGSIIAKVSGTVSKIQNKDNYNNTQPFMIITATDEYFISGSIGEFYLDEVSVGDTVDISSWETGTSAVATITEISEYPNTDSNNFYSGDGNNNSSSYQFKASFDRSSGIEIGSAVDITITPKNQQQAGLYIPSQFIRKDAAGSYVMKMNSDGVLEKTYIKVGKTVWGTMTEVRDGLTMEDYFAFPYGVGENEGVKCKIVDYLENS